MIEEKAKLAKLSVGEYLIRAGLNDTTVVILDGKELLHQVSKIGTNLNQLTLLAHQGKITCPDLAGVNQVLKKLLQQMISLTKK